MLLRQPAADHVLGHGVDHSFQLGVPVDGRWVGKAIVQAGPQRPVGRNEALIERPYHVPVVVPVGEELACAHIPIPIAPHPAQHAGEGEQVNDVLLVEELVVFVVGRDEPGVCLDASTRLSLAPGHDKQPLEPLVANAARVGGQVHPRPPVRFADAQGAAQLGELLLAQLGRLLDDNQVVLNAQVLVDVILA